MQIGRGQMNPMNMAQAAAQAEAMQLQEEAIAHARAKMAHEAEILRASREAAEAQVQAWETRTKAAEAEERYWRMRLVAHNKAAHAHFTGTSATPDTSDGAPQVDPTDMLPTL